MRLINRLPTPPRTNLGRHTTPNSYSHCGDFRAGEASAPWPGRQLVGARRHWGSLLTAMIAPAVFASAPCFVIADPHMALLSTTGTLAFYTFLLLPTALRFDFRRDLDRLATLKGLPSHACCRRHRPDAGTRTACDAVSKCACWRLRSSHGRCRYFNCSWQCWR